MNKLYLHTLKTIVLLMFPTLIFAQNWKTQVNGLGNNYAVTAICGNGNGWVTSDLEASGIVMYYTHDTGATFSPSTTNFGGAINTVYRIARMNGKLFAVNKNGIYKSVDSGETWTNITPNYTGISMAIQHDTIFLSMLYPSNDFAILYTTDEGAHWETLSTDTRFDYLYYKDGIIYKAINDGIYRGVAYSSDFGLSYNSVSGMSSFSKVWGMEKFNNALYIAREDGLYQIPANGTSGSVVLQDSIYAIKAIGNKLLVGTQSHGVFISSNGTTWTTANIGLPNNNGYTTVNHFTYNNTQVMVGLTTFLTGSLPLLYVTSLDSLGIIPTSIPKTQNIIPNITFYPNPTSGIIKINNDNMFQGKINISILNTLGQVVFHDTYPNENVINVNITTIPAGTYILAISDNEQCIKQKLVVNY